MGRRSSGLLLAGALGVLIGCGLVLLMSSNPFLRGASTLVEEHQVDGMHTRAASTRLGSKIASLADPDSWRHRAKTDELWAKEPTQEEDGAAGREGLEEEDAFGGIFALEEVDPLAISSLLIGLIVVTIGYEQAIDLLQEKVFYSGIGKLLLGKMVRELAILGFVSFSATVLMQFMIVHEEVNELFEYSHVLLFLAAVFYAIEISVISVTLRSVFSEFERRDQGATDEADAALGEEAHLQSLIQREQSAWAIPHSRRHCLHHALDSNFGSFLAGILPALQELKRTSTFKVLRFQFMARNGLLGTASERFCWSTYVKMTTGRRIEHLVEVNWKSWLLVILVISCAIIVALCWPQLPATHTLFLFLGVGWSVCVAMWLLLRSSEAAIDGLIIRGYEHRQAAELYHKLSGQLAEKPAKEQLPHRWKRLLKPVLKDESKCKTAASEASPLASPPSVNFLELVARAVQEDKAEAGRRQEEAARRMDDGQVLCVEGRGVAVGESGSRGSDHFHLQRGEIRMPRNASCRVQEMSLAVECKCDLTKAQHLLDIIDTLKGDPDAEAHVQPCWQLRLLPVALQTLQLVQCLYQGLVLTMFGRVAVIELGVPLGLALLVLMWLPTTLMSVCLTPHVLKNVAMANAVCEADHGVLDQMFQEFEHVGDYLAASQALEMMAAQVELSESEISEAEIVRSHVRNLAKLGEMKWRYRVVDEGQSPREEAIKVLNEALSLIERHHKAVIYAKTREHAKEEKSHSAAHGNLLSEISHLERQLQMEWAAELSEVKQGLGVTRLIFNTDRSEDALILDYLNTALQLRELAGDKAKMSETLNSLGSLKQKQGAYAEAEQHYTRSLEVRRALSQGSDTAKAKEKWQNVAQSLVSLGNLFSEMGDSKAGEDGAAASELYRRALEVLQDAKDAYTIGFSPGHPKVAWALEGMAKVYQKRGELRSAQEAMDGALAIRRSLQATAKFGGDGKKQLFSEELHQGERTKVEIEQRRRNSRNRLQVAASKAAGGRPKVLHIVLEELRVKHKQQGQELAEPSEPSVDGPSSLRQPLLTAPTKAGL